MQNLWVIGVNGLLLHLKDNVAVQLGHLDCKCRLFLKAGADHLRADFPGDDLVNDNDPLRRIDRLDSAESLRVPPPNVVGGDEGPPSDKCTR